MMWNPYEQLHMVGGAATNYNYAAGVIANIKTWLTTNERALLWVAETPTSVEVKWAPMPWVMREATPKEPPATPPPAFFDVCGPAGDQTTMILNIQNATAVSDIHNGVLRPLSSQYAHPYTITVPIAAGPIYLRARLPARFVIETEVAPITVEGPPQIEGGGDYAYVGPFDTVNDMCQHLWMHAHRDSDHNRMGVIYLRRLVPYSGSQMRAYINKVSQSMLAQEPLPQIIEFIIAQLQYLAAQPRDAWRRHWQTVIIEAYGDNARSNHIVAFCEHLTSRFRLPKNPPSLARADLYNFVVYELRHNDLGNSLIFNIFYGMRRALPYM